MFGGMFNGLFGGGAPKIDLNQGGDALGQAAAGAPMAFGSGKPEQSWLSGLLTKFNKMDPMQKSLMMNRIGRGFSAGMGGAMNAQVPQVRNTYQPMTQAQQSVMFNPYGGR